MPTVLDPAVVVRPEPPAAPQPPIGALLPVVGGDLRAPLVDGCTVRYANLDYAASAPALRSVADHVAEVLPYYSSVHRGAGFASQVSTRLYESSRQAIGEFVGARPGDAVVLTRNTTDALNLLARAVPAGGEVVFLDVEHHANLLPWQQRAHRWVTGSGSLAGTVDALAAELRRRPAALLAVTGASNVTGELLPIDELARLAHRHGARLVVDAAQLAPHRRIDLAACGADYVALSGHKLYAPFGAGALIGRRDWLDAAPAHLAGGGAVREVGPDGTEWADGPHRHEGGTPNVIGAAALAAACRAIDALPAGALQAHESALLRRLASGLQALDGVRTLRIWADTSDRVGVVGFVLAGHDPGRVAAYLSAEHGVGVRDGRFCAHPLLARLGHGGGALRASLGVGSSSQDVDRLLAGLSRLLTRGEGWKYVLEAGRGAPRPDPRPRAPGLGGPAAAGGSSPCQQPS